MDIDSSSYTFSTTVVGAQFTNNSAVGGAGGAGSVGGDGLGGVFNGNEFNGVPAPLSVADSLITLNTATGGAGATAGNGRGGGIYSGNVVPGVASHLTVTNTDITLNLAVGGSSPTGGPRTGRSEGVFVDPTPGPDPEEQGHDRGRRHLPGVITAGPTRAPSRRRREHERNPCPSGRLG